MVLQEREQKEINNAQKQTSNMKDEPEEILSILNERQKARNN